MRELGNILRRVTTPQVMLTAGSLVLTAALVADCGHSGATPPPSGCYTATVEGADSDINASLVRSFRANNISIHDSDNMTGIEVAEGKAQDALNAGRSKAYKEQKDALLPGDAWGWCVKGWHVTYKKGSAVDNNKLHAN